MGAPVPALFRLDNRLYLSCYRGTRSLPENPMESTELLTTNRKALKINLDEAKYGTFAEIGAGQEVVRWFFRPAPRLGR